MSQTYQRVPEIQTITAPLALKDSGDRTRFNERAESNLSDMARLAEDWNEKVVPPLNIVGEMANNILPSLHEVINVGANIPAILTVEPHVTNIDTVAASIQYVDTVGLNIADVDIVAANIADINTAAENIALIQAAPGHAQTATDKATEAAASAGGAAESASEAAVSATNAAGSETRAAESADAAAASATAAAASEANAAVIEAHVEQMEGNLMAGATAEALPGSAMRRDTDGNTKVALTPAHAQHATSQDYVDSKIETVIAAVDALSTEIAPTLAKVDTTGTVSQAVAAAVDAFSAEIEPSLAKLDMEGTVSAAIAAALSEGLGLSGTVLFSRLTAGSASWEAPDFNGDGSDYVVEIHLKGAGGGVSGRNIGSIIGPSFGGGGEGEIVIFRLRVTPGDTIPFVVGAGVAGGNGGTSTCGGYIAASGKAATYSTTPISGFGYAFILPGAGGGVNSVTDSVIRIAGQVGGTGYSSFDLNYNSSVYFLNCGAGGGKHGGAGAKGGYSSATPYPSQRGTNGQLGCGGGGDCYYAASSATVFTTAGGNGYIIIKKV